MGPTPAKSEGVLPNLGLGLRIEVRPRMNIRLDFGRDMVNKQETFCFNMTEAFVNKYFIINKKDDKCFHQHD